MWGGSFNEYLNVKQIQTKFKDLIALLLNFFFMQKSLDKTVKFCFI